MKFKKIMLVTLVLLAILTMGAVSASEDVASDDDGLAVIEEDASIDAPVEEVETDEVLSSPYEENGFDPIFENEVNLDSDEPVIDINTPDEGNFSISVDDGEETNVFNHEINEDDVETGYICWKLDDLEITETGTYFITAKFISPSGDETTILDNQELRVLSDDEYDDAEDGVIIWVDEGDPGFDLNNNNDLNAVFATVSVREDLNGNIVIAVYDNQGEYRLLDKAIANIGNYEIDFENEGFKRYFIALSDFNYPGLVDYDRFRLSFVADDEEIDFREYDIYLDEDIVKFGEHYEIKFYEFDGGYDQVNDDEIPVVDIWVPVGSNGRVVVTAEGVDDDIVNTPITDLDYDDVRGVYYLVPDSFSDLEDGTYSITVSYIVDDVEITSQTGTLTFNGKGSEYDEEDDAEDGVIIWVDEREFDLNDQDDLDAPFAYVSVREDVDGSIAIIVWSIGEGEEQEQFVIDLENINNTEADPNNEGFTIYKLSLNDLGDFNDLIERGSFKLAFLNGDEDEIDSHKYNIGNDDGVVTFEVVDDEDDEDDDAADGVVIWVDDEMEFDLNNQEDLDAPFAYVSVSNEFLKSNVIRMWDEDQEDNGGCIFFEKSLSEITNYQPDNENEDFTVYLISLSNFEDRLDNLLSLKHLKIEFFDVDENDNYMEIDSRSYNVEYDDDESTVRFWEVADEDDDEDDAADGVVIWVDEREFDLNDQDDLDAPFAFVSVQNDLNGRIVFFIWNEEEGDEQELFGFDLEDITNRDDDPDNEGFTIYKLSLNDLEGYEDLIECGSFKLAFLDDDGEIDSRNYDIEFDEGIVKFWESDDEEEIHGEGEYLEDVIFVNGNVITNDIIIYIPSNVSEIVDDEFEVWNDGDTYNFKLSELESADGFYVIKVRDLFDIDEVGEGRGLDIFIQFYDDGEKAYYASPEDDEYGIEVYTSPFVNDEAYILENGFVVSFRGFDDVDDEFTVTISQEGAADIVKTFKISEIEAFVDDYAFYELHLSDLDITEPGNYTIAVNFTKNGEELAYNVGNIDVATVLVRAHGPDEDEDPVVRDVSTIVFHIGVSEDIAGFARLFVDGVQVGEDISFADLEFDDWPSHYGRQIYLNNYHITENGTYTFKVEVYDENGRFLADCENELQIEVGENSFEFISGPYGNEGGIEVVIRTPLEDGQYYNLYFNGELAGNYTAGSGLVISDKYLDQYFEMKIFKPGVYDVNVTFFDGENETDVTTGSFSVNELALTSDKTVYIIYEDHIMISFNADLLDDDSLRAYYVYGWDRVQRDDEMIFNPYGGEDMKNDGMYNEGIVSFDIAWTPDGHYAMEEGTTLIYVVYRHGEERFGGFIEVNVVEGSGEYIFMTYDGVDPWFDVNTPSNVAGRLVLIENGEEKHSWNLEDFAEYSDEDGRWHHGIHIDAYILDEGDHEITLVYEDGNGVEMESRTFEITVEYNPNAGYEYILLNSESTVNPEFDINTETNVLGRLVLIEDGEEKHVWNLSDIAVYGDEDGRWHHGIYIDSTILDEGIHNITLVYEDGNGVVVESRNIEIEIEEDLPLGEWPEIFIMWSDWPTFEKVEYDLDSTDMIHIYPKDDDSELSDIRIVVKIGDKVYLDATLAELNLQAQINDHDELYYTIGPAHFTEDIAPGHYDNVIAYYYSPKYSITSDENGMPTYANLFGYSSVTFDDIEYTFGDEGSTTMVIDGATVSLENITVDNHPEAQIALQDNVITVSGLAVGNYILKVVTTPINEYYRSVEASANITVKEKVVPPVVPIDPNLTISVDDIREGTDAVITITTNSTFSGNVNVQIETDVYPVSVINGTGSTHVSGLAVGNYTAVATFEATETFDASTKNATFKVNKAIVPDSETAISTDSGSTGPNPVYSINLGPDATGTFSVKIGDKVYTEELKGGAATIEVTDLPAGTYEAVISYSGDAIYAPISKTVNATVKAGTVIKATAVTTTYGTSKNIVITLTDENGNVLAGKDVIVVLNGAKKVLTTDANGKASYAVGNKLAVKTYVASITFEGDASYVKSTGSAKVVVKKANPKLTAKKKTFKVKKAKKYSIVLKTDKGKALAKVKVTLTGKFKGKKIKITAKTNSKGKATFNLKKLTKKGKFTATVKFAGNKYYNAATKKAKITIKK